MRRGWSPPAADTLTALVASYAGRADSVAGHDARRARAELARTGRADGRARRRVPTRIDEGAFSGAARSRRSCARSSSSRRRATRRRPSRLSSRRGTGRWPARALRRASLPTWILPLARVFAWLTVEGREHLDAAARAGDLRGQSPEPHGHAGDPGGAAAARALPGRDGDGEGVLQAAFLPRAVRAHGAGSPTA